MTEAVDPLYGNVFMEQCSSYIIGTVRFKETSEARQLVEQIRQRLCGKERL